MKLRSKKIKMTLLRSLAYFDIFDYPLTEKELLSMLSSAGKESSTIPDLLKNMENQGIIYNIKGYYSLQKKPYSVQERIKGSQKADKWLIKAHRLSKLIAKFPYIRSIAISGSLSKNYAGPKSDIDYFIITKPGRLWIARTLLIIFKKIFLFNSRKYFCLNYFIDDNHLEIEEKNLFTATEIFTLKPLYGHQLLKIFFDNNSWVKKYYPGFKANINKSNGNNKKSFLNRFFELLLTGKNGDKIDKALMILTINHWKKKYGSIDCQNEFELMFKSSHYISKHHPGNFQQKIYAAFCKRQYFLKNKFNIESEDVSFFL